MQSKIIGGGYSFKDTYGYMNNPNLQYMSMQDFESITGLHDQSQRNSAYWEARDKFHAQSMAKLNQTTLKDNFTFTLDAPENNIYRNKNAWEALSSIVNGSGHVMAFDTETIGSFTGNIADDASQIAGLTEVSFAVEDFGNTRRLRDLPQKTSFVFGIDSKQRQWLENVLERKIKGDVLSDVEQSAMERMSRYSTIRHGDNIFSFGNGIFKGEAFNIAEQLNISNPNSIEDIKSGIEALSDLYRPDRDTQISKVVDYINKFNKQSDRVVIGQNLEYDINAINRYSLLHKGVSSITEDFQYADSMFGLRAFARTKNTTVADLIKGYNPTVANKRLGSLEAMLEAIGDPEYASKAAHNAFEDSLATLRVFRNKGLDVVGRALQTLQGISENPNEVNLQNSYININKKGNIRSSDFLVMDDIVTTGYQVSNQYWNFVGTGDTHFDKLTTTVNGQEKVLKDSQDKFVALFESANKDGAKLFKTFDSEQDFVSWLKYNVSFVNKNQADISLQTQIHNRDIARRVIDGFFDYGTVTKNNGKDAGGFASFKQYYNMYQELANISDDTVKTLGLVDQSGNAIASTKAMLNNISTADNIVNIIDYADKNGLSNVSGFFRTSKKSQALSAREVAIRNYDQRSNMQYVFDTFDLNKDFVDYAISEVDKIGGNSYDANLKRTMALGKLQQLYLGSDDVMIRDLAKNITAADINNVSVMLSDGSYTNIDASDIKRGTQQLQKAFSNGADQDAQVARRLLATVDDLVDRRLLTKTQGFELQTRFSSASSYAIAEQIATRLHGGTKAIRKLSVDEYREKLLNIDPTKELSRESTILLRKNHRTLLESSTSIMTETTGTIDDSFKAKAKDIISNINETVSIIQDNFNKETPDKVLTEQYKNISSHLKQLNYSESDIDQFMGIFYSGGKGKSNIPKFNSTRLDKDKVMYAYYHSGADKTADYLILTNQSNYAKTMSVLEQLGDNATQKEIKESLSGIASHFEIPYLDVIDLDIGAKSDEVIKKLTSYNGKEGHGARSVLMKQGDTYARYDTLSLNMYKEDGVWRGGIRDAGGQYLTSVRQRMQWALNAVSEGNFESANRALNNPNIARAADASAPQFGAIITESGDILRKHAFTQKDIDYAHMISLNPDGSSSLLDVMEDIVTEQALQDMGENASNKGVQAINALYEIFDEEYGSASYKNGIKTKNAYNAKRVFESDQFRQFYGRQLTGQSGGIGQEEFIKNYIKTHNNVNAQALKEMQNKGLLQIMAEATQNNKYFAQDISTAINLLAYDAMPDSVGSESMAHKDMIMIGGYNFASNNNSRLSGQYRPTYAQRANYRPYDLSGSYFDNPEKLSSNLGIHFGDVYAPKEFIQRLDIGDKYYKATDTLTAQNVSRRNIIGAVQSISDSEIRAGINKDALIASTNLENKEALLSIYDRMLEDLNTYEGKFYVRPSVANQNFFMAGDPKTMKSPEIANIFKNGTRQEQEITAKTLADLEGKSIKSGTIIGQKLVSDGQYRPIFYRGPEIENFTRANTEDLIRDGKTIVNVSQQLEDFKLFFGEEKGTAETLNYFTSLRKDIKSEQLKQLMTEIGLDVSDDFESNLKLMNQYTDAVYDFITQNKSIHKTIAIFNNNIEKHLTDMPFDTKWNLLAYHFNSQEGLDQLKHIINDTSKGEIIRTSDGKSFADHLSYHTERNTLMFDNPTDKGSINVLDKLINKIRLYDDEYSKAFTEQLDIFEQSNGRLAMQSIQRQFMNTFEAEKFRMDARVYQALQMQSDLYTSGNGAKLAERIRTDISSGEYDRNIVSIFHNSEIDNVWANSVRNRRGLLRPKKEQDMYLGILDSLNFLNGKTELANTNKYNIISLNANEIISNIPSSGANSEAYQDFIFKINGEYSDFIKTRAKLGSNNFNIKAASNEFLLDISDIGYVEYNKKKITQLMLPFQQIAVADENVFASDEATKKTVSFFNALKQHSEVNDEGTQRKLQQAFDDLMDAYKRELDTRNKDSLISKSIFRMDMPNSAGVLAKDAIVPTVDISFDLLQEITDLQNKLIRASESGTKISSNDINALQTKFIDRESATKEQISKLIASKDAGNIDMSLLKLTGDLNNKYSKYMISADSKTIESAMLVGKGTFKRTQMDTGRIGMQIFFDYYDKTPGLTKYDDYSRISKDKFRLFEKETKEVTENIIEEVKEIDQVKQFYRDLFTTFDETNHSEWATKTRDAIDVIFNSTEMTDIEKMSKASKKFGLRLNDYIKELDVYAPKEYGESYRKALVEEYKAQFLEEINSRFEIFGDKYAREVGILGLTNRYPNFNEKGVLPVRIYLDDTIKGNTARFLGPQFSLWQNLDFDGDTEFIKFLGNGGLYSKNAAESVLMNKQFKYMNEKNFNEFIKTLADQESLKAYRIGDETAFKAQLLKELNSDAYSRAKQSFISSLDKDSRRAFDEAHESIQDLLVNHSVQIKKEFQAFDEAMGSSITNPEMIKAAMQARIAKEYIGNFSKPNLDIRDAMTYMLNHAVINGNVEEETALLNIKDNLFEMLSKLEQKGIDTKHVHDATYLDSSSSWRLGVRKLFENANGAKQQSESEINKSIELLVKGSKKVYFKQANGENANEFIQQMVSNIKSKTIADFTREIEQIQGEVPDELFGQLYIRSLYEMSQRENAYDAFFGTFKNFASRDIADTLNNLELDDFEKVRQIVINNKDASGRSFDDLAKIIIARSMESSRTDELLNVNGRAIREGDLLAYDTSNGPALYKFTGMDTDIKSGKFVANFEEYDLDDVNKAVTRKRQFDGVTIREINENIKNSRYYEGAKAGNINHVIDLKNASRDHLNFNIRDLDNPETNEIFLRKELSRLSVENRLQVLTNTRGESDFKDTFEFLVKKEIPNISEEYSAESITGTIADIVGTDYSAFKKRSDIIEQYLDYGIETGAITGSKDAKELMRRINSEIANNPRSSINLSRYSGNIDSVNSILTNYLDGIEGVKIIDPGFLNVDIDNIRLSNEISNEINIAIANRESSLNKYAEDFYRTYISNPGEDIINDAFNIASKNAKETYAQTNELIFKSLSKSSDPEAEMFRVFNWDRVNDKIDLSKAKVGYGRYTGVQFIDLTQSQRTEILDQINNLDNVLAKDSLEYKAAINTRDLLNQFRGFSADSDLIDFSSKDLLAKSSRLKFEDLIEEQKKTINEAMNNARAEVRSMDRKTLLSGLKESIQDIGITKNTLKKGGLILGGVALAGIAGHALFNKDSSNSNVEVPKSMQGMTSGAKPMHIQNKNDLGYSDNERVAKENKPKRQIAPPSIKKNRTIYHDNASGFDFKVSAQSYNKLQEESYYKMAARAGAANTTLNVNKDNSRITDNWLENKFADLTE